MCIIYFYLRIFYASCHTRRARAEGRAAERGDVSDVTAADEARSAWRLRGSQRTQRRSERAAALAAQRVRGSAGRPSGWLREGLSWHRGYPLRRADFPVLGT